MIPRLSKGCPRRAGKRIRTAVFLAAGLALAGCASTRIVESWQAPGAGPLHFNKVLALAIVENESVRRVAEDALQSNLKGVQAVQSYKALGGVDLGDRERAKERLRQDGFDGVVALRLISSQQELSWTTSAVPLPSFWGFYGAAYPPAQLNVDTLVRVEISVYSLAEDKLIWSGISETYDPQNAEKLVGEVVEAAGNELRKKGLIAA